MFGALKRFFQRLDQTEEEIAFRRRVAERGGFKDVEFANRFFPDHTNQKIPVTVARVIRRELMVQSIRPEDNLVFAFPDIDFDELVKDILEELELRDESFDFRALDGTVGNLIDELTASWGKR